MEDAHLPIIIIFRAKHSRNSLFLVEMVKLMTYVFDYVSRGIISALKTSM